MKYLIANWKMNMNYFKAKYFINKWQKKNFNNKNITVIICPAYIHLHPLNLIIKPDMLSLGAQNVCHFDKGAYTGEISSYMLNEMKCKWVIVGHSERRSIYRESNMNINKKISLLLSENINPILCIGESLSEYNSGITKNILEKQITSALENIEFTKKNKLILAYEPVWAIGTGNSAKRETVEENHDFINSIVEKLGLNNNIEAILYGGSVNENNTCELLKINHVDGFLVGTTSLDVDKFYSIYKQF